MLAHKQSELEINDEKTFLHRPDKLRSAKQKKSEKAKQSIL